MIKIIENNSHNIESIHISQPKNNISTKNKNTNIIYISICVIMCLCFSIVIRNSDTYEWVLSELISQKYGYYFNILCVCIIIAIIVKQGINKTHINNEIYENSDLSCFIDFDSHKTISINLCNPTRDNPFDKKSLNENATTLTFINKDTKQEYNISVYDLLKKLEINNQEIKPIIEKDNIFYIASLIINYHKQLPNNEAVENSYNISNATIIKKCVTCWADENIPKNIKNNILYENRLITNDEKFNLIYDLLYNIIHIAYDNNIELKTIKNTNVIYN